VSRQDAIIETQSGVPMTAASEQPRRPSSAFPVRRHETSASASRQSLVPRFNDVENVVRDGNRSFEFMEAGKPGISGRRHFGSMITGSPFLPRQKRREIERNTNAAMGCPALAHIAAVNGHAVLVKRSI
jgi:hypothetical protein